jgi:biotin-dependent carboxylase-like uncharacterized protein
MIEVIKPGLATSIQDAGRSGYYHLGIPLSGALDQFSYQLANLLVGNEAGAAAIECTLLGPQLKFHAPGIVAVTGAEVRVSINGVDVPRNASFAVRSGDLLTFDFMRTGARTYIAIAGGIDVPVVLGSRSTYGVGAFGGFNGRQLRAGDRLPVGTGHDNAAVGRTIDEARLPRIGKDVILRVMTGLYYHRLLESSAMSLFADTWTVSPEADRTGYRFKGGATLRFVERTQPFGAGEDPSNIVDAGYPYGSIQVPGGRQPIILHRDAVSGGGYATIGTVISADMDLIAQMQPHNRARFVVVDMAQALDARGQRTERMNAVRAELR